MSSSHPILAKIEEWTLGDDGDHDIHIQLNLPGFEWVELLGFSEVDGTITIRYRRLSLGGFLRGEAELVCSIKALKAARRVENIKFDDEAQDEIIAALGAKITSS